MADESGLSAQGLYTVAKNQKWLIYLLLVMIALNLASLAVQAQVPEGEEASGNAATLLVAMGLVQLLAIIAAMVAMWKVLRTTGSSVAVCVAALIGLLIPLASLIVLVMGSIRATRVLRDAGYEIGFLGATGDSLQRLRAAAEGAGTGAAPEPPPVSTTNE